MWNKEKYNSVILMILLIYSVLIYYYLYCILCIDLLIYSSDWFTLNRFTFPFLENIRNIFWMLIDDVST